MCGPCGAGPTWPQGAEPVPPKRRGVSSAPLIDRTLEPHGSCTEESPVPAQLFTDLGRAFQSDDESRRVRLPPSRLAKLPVRQGRGLSLCFAQARSTGAGEGQWGPSGRAAGRRPPPLNVEGGGGADLAADPRAPPRRKPSLAGGTSGRLPDDNAPLRDATRRDGCGHQLSTESKPSWPIC